MFPRPRIALYSHDAQGLGHVRRNLAIARSLACMDPAPDVLVLTGAPEAPSMPRPGHCDVITLPTLTKNSCGAYRARELSGGLDAVVALRSSVITSALVTFAPDLLIVDKLPSGFGGELETALHVLTRRGSTRVVLGVRDVLDDPVRTRQDWEEHRGSETVARWYDQVWVYSDPSVLDPIAECALPADLQPVTRYTGYLSWGRVGLDTVAEGLAAGGRAADLPVPPYVLGIVGGGQDGAGLARAFADARLPAGHRGVIVTGPHMPADGVAAVEAAAAHRPEINVSSFISPLEPVLRGAAAIVTMGGYNTVCELLTTDVPALVVPRTRPRREQLIRAERMAHVGLLDVLHPDDLIPARLGEWLGRAVARPRQPREHVDLHGLSRLRDLASDLLTVPSEQWLGEPVDVHR